MGSDASPSTGVDALTTAILEEFKALRAEEMVRSNHRLTLLTSTILSTGALMGIAIDKDQSMLLLFVPMVACLFGFLTVFHTRKIGDLGSYMGQCIEKRLNTMYPYAMGWHISEVSGSRFMSNLSTWHLPMMLIVLLPSCFSIYWFLQTSLRGTKQIVDLPSEVLVLLVIDCGLLLYYAFTYVFQLHLGRSPRRQANAEWRRKFMDSMANPA